MVSSPTPGSVRSVLLSKTFAEAPGYRTADRRLGPMADVTLGGSSSLDLPAIGPARLRVQVRVAHAWFRYADAVIPARDAWIAGLGAGATF
jgi:hypothetical protein